MSLVARSVGHHGDSVFTMLGPIVSRCTARVVVRVLPPQRAGDRAEGDKGEALSATISNHVLKQVRLANATVLVQSFDFRAADFFEIKTPREENSMSAGMSKR
jgi:hypothetical protein